MIMQSLCTLMATIYTVFHPTHTLLYRFEMPCSRHGHDRVIQDQPTCRLDHKA